jgi:glutaredoxin-like protein
MSLLNEEVQQQVREALASMTAPVKVVMFTQGASETSVALECEMCTESRQIVEEVAALSDKISVEVRDFVADAEMARQYNIDKIPAMAIVRDGDQPIDYGIRLYGIPSGYEFSTLIEDLLMVSRGEHGLNAATVKELAKLAEPVRIQVYITPTCPYCPRAVLLAHKLAMASPLITADMVESMEFPQLANKYQVYGVPRTVINDVVHIEGAVPEANLVQGLMTVLDQNEMARLRAEFEGALN